MALSHAFRYPYGGGGYGGYDNGELARELFRPSMLAPTPEISRKDDLQLRLGSLAAAFGNWNRVGGLGQALAQAGAVYQQQKAATLAAAFQQAQEEARMRRQDELFRQSQEDRLRRIEDEDTARKAAADDKEALRQAQIGQLIDLGTGAGEAVDLATNPHAAAAVIATRYKERETEKERQALIARQIDLGSTAASAVANADNPAVAASAINELELARRERSQTFQVNPRTGAMFLTRGPNGEMTMQTVPPQKEPPTPQEGWLREHGYDPNDPFVIERARRDQGLEKGDGEITERGKYDLTLKIAQQMQAAAIASGNTKPGKEPTLGEFFPQAKDAVDGLIKVWKPGDKGGPPPGTNIAGTEVQPKGKSSPASGKQTIIQVPPYGKLDDADKAAMNKVLEMVAKLPDPKQQAAMWKEFQSEIGPGKSWSRLWIEIQQSGAQMRQSWQPMGPPAPLPPSPMAAPTPGAQGGGWGSLMGRR